MIEAVNLTRAYQNNVVVRALNFKVSPGEICCLLGGPGSGKSTTIDLYLNLIKPTSGVAKLGGYDVTLQPIETKRRLGYIPPVMPLYENLTGLENVRYLGALAGYEDLSPAAIRDLFHELALDPALADQLASTYSVAVRVRVGLAVALARNAREFLLDEPTLSLTAAETVEFGSVIERLAAGSITGEAATVLWATSDPAVAAAVATRVGLMRPGKALVWFDAREMSATEFSERCFAHMSVPTR